MPLSLHLELDRKKVTLGDLPVATVRLINEGPEVILVNARMLVAPAAHPDNLKELSFFIEGPEGSENLKRFRVNAGRATAENFARLFPGEYIFKTYDLSRYFSYDKTGKYKITAQYGNAVSLSVNNLTSWTGKLVSNEEFFEITN
ncbi:MAG: hypothetical protein LOY03_16025 [Cyclobacteriaceae bacterium]|jgi:hypothetical protein|nr:hypothetical protein [Cyclobacteriaceae bacterium]